MTLRASQKSLQVTLESSGLPNDESPASGLELSMMVLEAFCFFSEVILRCRFPVSERRARVRGEGSWVAFYMQESTNRTHIGEGGNPDCGVWSVESGGETSNQGRGLWKTLPWSTWEIVVGAFASRGTAAQFGLPLVKVRTGTRGN